MPKLDIKTAKRVNAAETGGGFTLLDEDEYVLELAEVKEAAKPNRNGDHGWIWSFKVVTGQSTGTKFAGKQCRLNTWFGEDSDWFTKMVFEAFEVKPNVDTDTLVGKQIKGVITQREQTVGRNKGKMTHDVSTVFPVSQSADDDADDWADGDGGGSTDEPDF
jgi:hypothetical protein